MTRKLLFTTMFAVFGLLSAAQQTLTIPYQALVRDAAGNPLPNQPIEAKISLLKDSLNATPFFIEIHQTTTNQFGQLDLQIGSVETTAFDIIDWSAGKMFIKLAVNISGGTDYSEIATVPLLAVPFAKYAEEAAGWKKNETGISFMDGNVGIGTTNSNSRLNVGNGSINEQGIHINAKINSVLRFYRKGVIKWGIIDNLGESGKLGFYNYTSNTQDFVIDSNGYAGFGTSAPLAGLHVTKTRQYNGNNISAILGNGSSHWTYFGGITGGRIRGSNEGYIVIDGNPEGSGDKRVWINNACSSHVSIAYGGGSVGIGYSTPSYRLHVNGVIKGNNVMYDYTKSNSSLIDYKQLISLSDLKKFIEAEKQLPGQSQAIENDTVVDLAKMNTFLVNKIEDLTIYTIRQQEEIESQKAEYAELRQLFIELKSEIENIKNK